MSMNFRRDRFGRVFVEPHFDETMMITGELLRAPSLDDGVITRDFRTIKITCENGTQKYRMISYERHYDVFTCRAILL